MGWDGVAKLLLLLQRARPIKHNCCSRGNLSIKHKTPDCRWMKWCRGGVNKHLDYKIIFFCINDHSNSNATYSVLNTETG